jgi:hypothetical protein
MDFFVVVFTRRVNPEDKSATIDIIMDETLQQKLGYKGNCQKDRDRAECIGDNEEG